MPFALRSSLNTPVRFAINGFRRLVHHPWLGAGAEGLDEAFGVDWASHQSSQRHPDQRLLGRVPPGLAGRTTK